jgi:outer membrane immunogenic protein
MLQASYTSHEKPQTGAKTPCSRLRPFWIGITCSWTQNLGKGTIMMRRLLLSATALAAVAGSALAADLPYRQPPPAYVPPPLFSWTGFYLGGQIGYAWGRDSLSVTNPVLGTFITSSYGPDGVIGGAHVGYNLQLNTLVAGVEGDVEGTDYSTSAAIGGVTFGTKIPVQGSVRLRLGLALDRALLYVTGGAAFAGFDNTYQTIFGFDTISKTRTGWTVGGGIEYAVTDNWTIRAEYRYADYGKFSDYPVNSFPFPLLPGTFVQNAETQHSVRAGFSYKFGGLSAAPVVATY